MDVIESEPGPSVLSGALRAAAVCILSWAMLLGCATYNPQPLNEELFRKRATTQANNNVRVSAVVLSAAETKAVFGLALYNKGIQPVWLEIENITQHRMWFAPLSIDRNYFSPLEVAYMHHSGYSVASRQSMDRFFHQHTIRNPIKPRTVQSGFVFTNLELGTKAFNVEIVGKDEKIRTFTFLIPVAGLQVDHREVDWANLYSIHEKVEIGTPQELRSAIEALPCCTTDEDGNRMADPINVVIIGTGRDILYALLRSGWDETAAAASYDPRAQLPWEFRYQPVKPLYLFDRAQDSAFRKSRSTLNERNQLRFWLSPLIYKGQHVWVGQISRIVRRAVWDKFVIEPDVDEARAYLLQDLWYNQALMKYGYVRTARVATLSEPRNSLLGDEYFTDGLCLVLWIAGSPVSFSGVQFEPWEKLSVERRSLLLGR